LFTIYWLGHWRQSSFFAVCMWIFLMFSWNIWWWLMLLRCLYMDIVQTCYVSYSWCLVGTFDDDWLARILVCLLPCMFSVSFHSICQCNFCLLYRVYLIMIMSHMSQNIMTFFHRHWFRGSLSCFGCVDSWTAWCSTGLPLEWSTWGARGAFISWWLESFPEFVESFKFVDATVDCHRQLRYLTILSCWALAWRSTS
jgi:hypothetical protein